MDIYKIDDLKGQAFLDALYNYMQFIESDMDAAGWEYADELITLDQFMYDVEQREFTADGELI